MLSVSEKEKEKEDDEEEEDEGGKNPVGGPACPVTPRMLIKALKRLRKNTFRGLGFSVADVTSEILRGWTNVEQDFELLYTEVSDKLFCAAAAGLIGTKENIHYYAFNQRQKGTLEDSRSELMFWLLYRRLLSQKYVANQVLSSEEVNKSQQNSR